MLFTAVSGTLFSYSIWQSHRLLFLSVTGKLVAVCFNLPVAHRILLTTVSQAHFCGTMQSLTFLYNSICFTVILSVTVTYSRINSTNSPSWGAGVSGHRRMSQVGRVPAVVCARSVCFCSQRWRSQDWSAYVAAAIMWLKCKVRRTRAEGCHTKWRWKRGCHLFILAEVIWLKHSMTLDYGLFSEAVTGL